MSLLVAFPNEYVGRVIGKGRGVEDFDIFDGLTVHIPQFHGA